ncbi:hypothetical protein AF70_00023290 [Pseudomonas sp. KD5]|uniref:Uncharacterized protein n=1 Tax=Pseudomonas umsongensis TaxID=198618 RepID=A0ACC5MDX2_9PSED|nr:hypothetical protein [Pseudomonas umsongensis]NMN76783.1 hypothetical protein [Pseudomonas sp. KD5]GID08552.1 hypothetical protein TMM008_57540 [Pseudomonas sp. 008]
MGEFVITHRKYLLELKALLVAHRLPRKGNRGQTTIFLMVSKSVVCPLMLLIRRV